MVAITRGEQALVGNPPVNKLFVCPKPEAVGIAKKHEGCSGNLQVNEVRDSVVAVALGAVAGGIVGGTAGLFIYTIDACFTGEASFNGIWKSYTAGALTGAGIGVWFPV